jgi:hypothetical protein
MLIPAAAAVPHLLYPQGLRTAWLNRSTASLLDAYVQLAQEMYGNAGFAEGLWLFRHLIPVIPETGTDPVPAAVSRKGAELVP